MEYIIVFLVVAVVFLFRTTFLIAKEIDKILDALTKQRLR